MTRAAWLLLTAVPLGLLLCGCGSPYRLGIEAGDSDVAFRIREGGTVRTWLDRDGKGLTLLVESGPPSGVVELIDPTTCEVLDSKALPQSSSFVFVDSLYRESPSGKSTYDYVLEFGPLDDYTGSPPTPPNFSGCPDASASVAP
jgi:hypothetical protein